MKCIGIFLVFISMTTAWANNHFSRISMGGYLSNERFKAPSDGSYTNDHAALFSRYYLGLFKKNKKRMYLRADIRNDYNFFGALNKSTHSLDQQNRFQIRKLYHSNQKILKNTTFHLGRHPVFHAGSTMVDGLSFDNKLTKRNLWGGFIGLNPVQIGSYKYRLEENARTIGSYHFYQKSSPFIETSLSMTNAFSLQEFYSEIERFFWFNQTHYHNKNNQFNLSSYLDLSPRVYFQNLYLGWEHIWHNQWSSHIQGLVYDSLTYERNQNLLHPLESSPYQQSKMSVSYRPNKDFEVTPSYLFGHRQIDNLDRQTFELRLMSKQSITIFDQIIFKVLYSNDFVSNDYESGIQLFRFDNKSQFSIGQSYRVEERVLQTLHSSFTDLNYDYYFDRDLGISTTIQYAFNENVEIASTFLQLIYQWGEIKRYSQGRQQ